MLSDSASEDSSRRNRILFFPTWYPDRHFKSSLGTFVREHVRAASLYDDVTVLLYRVSDKKGIGIEIEYYEDNGIKIFEAFASKFPVPGLYGILFPIYVRKILKQVFEKWGIPDVIHTQDNIAPWAIYGLKHLRKPFVISQHWTGFLARKLTKDQVKIFGKAFKKAKFVLPANAFAEKDYKAYDIKANIRWLPNALNTDVFYPDETMEKKPWLLHVSGLDSEHKRFDDILNAFAQLIKKKPDAVLHVAGGTPEMVTKRENQAREILPEGSFKFHGVIPKEELADLMRQSSGFIFPSSFETFGCVLMEAMACGCPVLTTSVGGVPAVVQENDGIFVDVGDITAIAEGMTRLLNGDHKFDMKRISNQTRDRFSHETVGKLLHQIHNECISGHI